MPVMPSILIPLLPLLGFLLILLVKRSHSLSSAVGTLAILGSFVVSAIIAYQYFFVSGQVGGVYQKIIPLQYAWLQFTPNVSIDMGILLDPISVMMCLVVTFVSSMVHIYSLGYMKGETRFGTYYAYLSLFTFSMLGLVLSSNLFQVYIFWELVGVSSYLLVGFYFNKPSAVAAAKKAFIVTRFADLGFLIGILILGTNADTLDIQTLITRLTSNTEYLTGITSVSFIGMSALTWALLLVFIGGAGKSAMFPLHIWLPDAMEGPTPVSALIHAATMVVAGVYLVARLFPVYAIADHVALQIVAVIGIFSSLFAAVIACVQTDIKRVLAYSTISQIGFMMFALGVSGYGGEAGLGYTASMFHLFTHAMFKALLFLCAGSVIHYVHSNEMKDMGGLRKYMPVTHIAFLIACLAIAGIPPFAGFFSKEEILLATYNSSKPIFYAAILTAALTSFYMFRLYFSIFWSRPYVAHGHDHHGEGTFSMKLPLVLLMVLSIVVGFVPFGNFVSSDGSALPSEFHLMFSIAPVALSVFSILLAMAMYRTENSRPANLAASLSTLYRSAYNRFYIDEIYLFVTRRLLFNMIGRPAAWIDRNVVDGAVNATASVTEKISGSIKGIQSGRLQQYASYFFAGIVLFILVYIYLWTS